MRRASASRPDFPVFRASAIDRPTNRAERGAVAQTRVRLREIFAPTQPVADRTPSSPAGWACSPS